MTIALTTPTQINAWVLLSRISQCHIHMKGYPVKGLHKWLVKNVPDCADTRTVKQAYPRLLDYCDQFGLAAPGGEQCHYQVLVKGLGLYHDQGVFDTMADVEADENIVARYAEGRVVILRTMDEPRPRDRKIQMVMA